MIDKRIIKNNFSKYARYYDKYSSIQNLCALKLIAKIGRNSFKKILDIGCGTGNYTKLLGNKFPNAQVKAIDISREMIEVARNKLKNERIEFIIADGEMIDLKEQFDLVSSNASFQWFENLEKTLLKYRELLNKNSIISFSIFGPLTFFELDKSLRKLFGKDASISSCNFIEKKEIIKVLKGLFKKTEVDEEIYKEKYRSLAELLKKIKYTGARGNGTNRRSFWTAKKICNLEKIYKRDFRDIVATYQVFFCKGIA